MDYLAAQRAYTVGSNWGNFSNFSMELSGSIFEICKNKKSIFWESKFFAPLIK